MSRYFDTLLDPRFNLGDRVRMSKLGRERHPKYGEREGIVVGPGSPSSWRIKFDDRKSVQAIHQDYLERVHPHNAASDDRSDANQHLTLKSALQR